MAGQITTENVERVFGSAKTNEEQQKLIDKITGDFTELAKHVLYDVPNCAHRSAALRSLLEAKMMCVDAIAKGGLV